MAALHSWNGGVIIISHDERFITNVAKEVNTCFVDGARTRCTHRDGELALRVRGRDRVQVQGRRAGVQGERGGRRTCDALDGDRFFCQSLIVSNIKLRP